MVKGKDIIYLFFIYYFFFYLIRKYVIIFIDKKRNIIIMQCLSLDSHEIAVKKHIVILKTRNFFDFLMFCYTQNFFFIHIFFLDSAYRLTL